MSKPLILARPVIAITGSAGKTTTKEMIAAVLRRRWQIFKSRLNGNFYTNIRKYAKEITPAHRAIVLEYGMLRLGHIKRSCRIIQPNQGVITNVGTAHIGNVGGKIAGVAKAKSELIRYMRRTGKLFLNADDVHSRKLRTKGFRGKIYKVGVKRVAHYRAYHVRYTENGMAFDVKLDGKAYPFFVPVFGTHNIYNALFAIAVCHQLRCRASLIQAGLRTYQKPKRRLSSYRLPGGARLIDDTYSANPHAMKAAVDVLSKVGRGTNIAVLGSMMELGSYSVRGHRDVGRYLARKKVDYLYTYGAAARYIGKAATLAGLPAAKVKHCATRQELHKSLVQHLEPNATILVKGSNKMKMSLTVRYLRRVAKARTTS